MDFLDQEKRTIVDNESLLLTARFFDEKDFYRFTVFGPDAVDIPEAWFKHKTPHPLVSNNHAIKYTIQDELMFLSSGVFFHDWRMNYFKNEKMVGKLP